MNGKTLVFLHLSDIHFHKPNSLDLDLPLRRALEMDARDTAEKLRELHGEIDGIIVSGDIAFSGNVEEYAEADSWFKKLSTLLKSDPSAVWIIPGNHDVNRQVLTDPMLKEARSSLKRVGLSELDGKLNRFLNHGLSFKSLLSPLNNYNYFARSYGCGLDGPKLCWEDDFTLNDGSILRLRGLNSALVSDEDDSDNSDSQKMILGASQYEIPPEDGVTHLVICHHPRDWLRDGENAEEAWHAQAALVLLGHKHMQRQWVINNKTLVIAAGAVQPERQERDWLPKYNFIALRVEEKDGARILNAELWARLYDKENRVFVPDYVRLEGSEHKNFALDLPRWRDRPTRPASPHPSIPIANQEGQATTSHKGSEEVNNMAFNRRRLVHAYLSLPLPVVLRIALDLGIIRDEDKELSDSEKLKVFVTRAQSENKLHQLWDLVAKVNSEISGDNPF